MPTRPTKGDHGHSDRGSSGRGSQKATYGTTVSSDVAEERREVIEGADASRDREGGDPTTESERSRREA